MKYAENICSIRRNEQNQKSEMMCYCCNYVESFAQYAQDNMGIPVEQWVPYDEDKGGVSDSGINFYQY